MQVSVTFRHMDPSEPLRAYAVEKVERIITKYLKNALEAHVILSSTRHRAHNVAEIHIHASQFDIAAHAENADLYAGIDLAIDKVEAQVRRHKDRINDRKGRAAGSTKISVEVLEPQEDRASAKVVETSSIEARPLSVDDAVLQLELSHAEFLVFRNAANDTISVLYRRRDGQFGLLIPNA